MFRFTLPQDQRKREERKKTFLLNLCLQAALHQPETIETTIENLWTWFKIPNYQHQDFLLDLYSHVKSIDLSKRKASILLEVLKLQPEKKPVELKGWSDEESELKSFLQCLPYISQLM